MLGEGTRLLLLSVGGWLRTRMAEFAVACLAVVFVAVALVLGSIAAYQALAPQQGPAASLAIIALAYLVLGGAAALGCYSLRRRRHRIARGTNWAGAVPKVTPGLILAALAAGAMLGGPRR